MREREHPHSTREMVFQRVLLPRLLFFVHFLVFQKTSKKKLSQKKKKYMKKYVSVMIFVRILCVFSMCSLHSSQNPTNFHSQVRQCLLNKVKVKQTHKLLLLLFFFFFFPTLNRVKPNKKDKKKWRAWTFSFGTF